MGIPSGYVSTAMTDENTSDREKNGYISSEESEDSDLETDESVSVDDIIRCKCNEIEEQGFMIQVLQPCFVYLFIVASYSSILYIYFYFAC